MPQLSNPSELNEPSISDLIGKLSSETGTRIRREMSLVTLELKEKASAAGKHGLLIAFGALFIAVGAVALTGALIVLNSKAMDVLMSALCVGLVLAVTGYSMSHKGMTALRQVSPKPTKTLATWKENKEWAQALVR